MLSICVFIYAYQLLIDKTESVINNKMLIHHSALVRAAPILPVVGIHIALRPYQGLRWAIPAQVLIWT